MLASEITFQGSNSFVLTICVSVGQPHCNLGPVCWCRQIIFVDHICSLKLNRICALNTASSPSMDPSCSWGNGEFGNLNSKEAAARAVVTDVDHQQWELLARESGQAMKLISVTDPGGAMCSLEGGGKTVRSAPLLFYVATKCGKRDLAADMCECEGERHILSSV